MVTFNSWQVIFVFYLGKQCIVSFSNKLIKAKKSENESLNIEMEIDKNHGSDTQ